MLELKNITCLLFLILGMSAQVDGQHTENLGFQVNELVITRPVPLGYVAIKSIKLSTQLKPNEAYEISFWIGGKQIQNRGYTYPINVFPSNESFQTSRYIFGLVESRDILPTLKVGAYPFYSGDEHFRFVVRPDTTFKYFTIVLKKDEFESAPIDFQKDIWVKGIFVQRLPTNDSTEIALPKKIKNRPLRDTKATYTVKEASISIALYDHKKVDKDTVTIFLNGIIVVNKLELSKKKKTFAIQLKLGRNIIALHAENLGEISPNTAAIIIRSRKKEFLTILNSDLGSSEYFTIIYEPE